MAKGDHDNAQSNVNMNQNRANEQYDVFRGDIQKTNPGGAGNVERQNILGSTGNNTGLTGAAQTGLVDPNAIGNLRSIAAAPDVSNLTGGGAYSGYSGLAGNGGWGNADTGSLNTDVGGLQAIGNTGGFDPTELGSIRSASSNLAGLAGPQGYGNFAATGGFSDADKANFRARANSPIAALYANQDQAVARNNSISGGGNTAANTAARLALSRQSAQQIGQNSINTEATLADQIRQNKLAGLAGMSGAYTGSGQLSQNLGQSLAANKLYGFTGAGNLTTGMVNSRNAATEAALAGMSDLEKAQAANALTQRGQDINANTDINSAIQGGRLQGLAGMQQLYGTDYQPYVNNQNLNLNALNQQTGANQGFAGQYINASMIPSTAQTALGTGLGILGAAGGAMTGLGAIGVKV